VMSGLRSAAGLEESATLEVKRLQKVLSP